MTYKMFTKKNNPLPKLVAVFLVFGFLAVPLAPALADITDTSSTPATSADSVSPSLDSASSAVDAEPSTNNDSQNSVLATPPADSTPSDALTDSNTDPQNNSPNTPSKNKPMSPSSPGQGNSGQASTHNSPLLSQKMPEIDKNTGALNYNYSIAVPPGRNNLQPSLALSYSSNSNDKNSVFGYGWSLGIPFIERLNKTGVDKLYDPTSASYFYSSLDGELSAASVSSYVPRTENGSFNKYTFSNNQWAVLAKDGTKYTFGLDSNSQQSDPQNTGHIYKWMLQEIRDANDNYISFSYFKDAGQIYPLAIKYTGSGNADGIFEVDFQRASRTDNSLSFSTGFSVVSNYYINEIDAKVNGNWTTKYVLSYTKSKDTNRSLLSSITASGQDNIGNITSLPATTFNYQNSGAGWTGPSSLWAIPPVPTGYEWNLQTMPPQFADLNGDGLPDLVMIAAPLTAPDYKDFEYLNNGHGWTPINTSWSFPAVSPYWDFSSVRMPQFPDINGDGLPDLVRVFFDRSASGVWRGVEYINTGSGWTLANDPWSIPSAPSGYEWHFQTAPPQFSDINGDGLPDLVLIAMPTNTNFDPKDYEYINNGYGWTLANSSWAVPSAPTGYVWQLQNMPPQFIDLNGDGLSDLLMVARPNNLNYDSKDYEYLNTGFGWTLADASWKIPAPPQGYYWDYGNYRQPQFADLNGDGLSDLVVVARPNNLNYDFKDYEYINTGSGWTPVNTSWSLPSPPQGNWDFPYGAQPQFSDINGDGLPDFIGISVISGKFQDYEYINNGQRQDLLSQIIYPQGGNTTVSYKTAAQYTDSSGNHTNQSPYPIFTVSQITNSDGAGIASSFSYYYQSGTYYYSNPFDRQFSGYKLITQTDAAGNVIKTYYNTGTGTDSAHGQFKDSYFEIGKPYRIENYDNIGSLYAKAVNKWDDVDLGNGSKFVKLAQTVNSTYDGDATHRDTAESYAYDNANGNALEKIQYGEVSGNDDGTFSDVGNDKFTTDYAYATGQIVALPSQSTIIDQNSAKVKESKFYYDTQPFGSVVKGNLTRQEDWKTGAAYISNQKTYNSYGLMMTSTDPRGKTTQYAYDSYNLYPVTVTNAMSQATQYNYDYPSGQITQKTDPNARVFAYAYDGLGRLLQEKQPDLANPSLLVIKTLYAYTDTPGAVSANTSSYLDDSTVAQAYTYFDGLGRKIQERAQAENANFSTKDYIYNNLGLLQKESLPYFSTGLSKTSPTNDVALYVNYTYDAMGRVVVLANAVGATTNTYSDWKLTTTDANGKTKDLYKDAYDNLIQVDEHNAGQTASAFYNYNYLAGLTKITDALSNVRNFTYDGLGQRLTAEDLHALADTTFGVWTYAYDDAGNLTKTIDPNNQTINYTYDDINRQLSEDYAGQTGVEVSYTYDSGADGKGRLTGMQNSSVAQNNVYNALGFVKSESKVINSKTYVTVYDYDRQGNQTIITNPDNSQIKNIYNSANLLDKTQRKESADANFTDVVSNFDYSPTAKATAISYANGASTINTYDAQKLYRLNNKITTIALGARGQDLTYTYDAVGNITAIIDASATNASKTSQYIYDDLNRLASATITNVAASQAPYAQTYTYDAIGNILNRTETIGANPTVTYTYNYAGNTGNNYANPHAVTSISDGATTTGYTYDNNGNMATEGPLPSSGQDTKIYTFDYNNRLAQSSVPGIPVPPPPPNIMTFYPSAGDGSVYYNNSSSWSTAHNAVSGNSANYTSATFNVKTGKFSATNYIIERAFLPFNTAALPDNAIITDVKLKVYIDSKLDNNNDGNDWVSVAQSSQPSTTALVNADYSKDGSINNPTEGIDASERKDITDVAAGKYLAFNLNSTGKDWISKTGFTKLGLREGHDIINKAFVGTSGQVDQLKIRSSEYSGTSSDPRLEVTYTTPPITPSPTIITYAYDSSGQRIILTNTNTSTSTVYPTKNYNIDNAAPTPKVTKHLFAGSLNIATIEGSGTSATAHYTITDNLGGSSLVTNQAGTQEELMDYFPFGALRIDNKSGAGPTAFSEQRKYIGQEFDTDTGLAYLNARYYNATLARFVSEDPIAVNNPEKFLADPQSLNTYSYARNNPITLSDPTGLFWKEASSLWQGAGNAFLTDNAFGIGRQSRSDSYFTVGQKIGDTTALIQGSFQIATGILGIIGGTTGGLALAPVTGGVSIAGGIAIDASGVALTAYGLSASGTASYYLSKGKGGGDVNSKRSVTKSEIDAVKDHWAGTNTPTEESIRYHYEKHGAGQTLQQYTKDAKEVYNQYKDIGREIPLKNGEMGVKINVPNSEQGGIYTQSGKIVSHWYGK